MLRLIWQLIKIRISVYVKESRYVVTLDYNVLAIIVKTKKLLYQIYEEFNQWQSLDFLQLKKIFFN